MIKIEGTDVNDAYLEASWKMKIFGLPENSRNGPVVAIPTPAFLSIQNPQQRVLFDEQRNCNPFFHVMETIWMFSGDGHVGFPARFNSTYVNYAEADGSVHGAYGKRWRDHFAPKEIGPKFRMDQIQLAIAMLKKNFEDRRVVLSMWDTPEDLGATFRDLPCNTHIYFRGRQEYHKWKLDMTVCNRSNDLLWGMLGANVVHMTYLQELIAQGAGMLLGTYQVFTNNLHIYQNNPNYFPFLNGVKPDHTYRNMDTYPLLRENEKVEDLLADCEDMVKDDKATNFRTEWMRNVGLPMKRAWEYRRTNPDMCNLIMADDWRKACRNWIDRKTQSSVTLMGP